MPYGQELVLDLEHCDPQTFTRDSLQQFFVELCERIDMERCDLHFWDYADLSAEEDAEARKNPHTYGVSAVQFIITSSIVVHSLPLLKSCFVNVFSCKPFDQDAVVQFAEDWFDGVTADRHFIERGVRCQ